MATKQQATWGVRVKEYPKKIVDFVSDINIEKAKKEWIKKYPQYHILSFDFINHVYKTTTKYGLTKTIRH